MISIHAVLTGDIVNSTQLEAVTEERLLKELGRILQPYAFEFFRGDSFQAYLKDPADSLRVALLCRTAAMSMVSNDLQPASDIRISIGIGTVMAPVKILGSAKGEAFLLSGRSFDEIQQSDARLSIVTENKIANIGLQVIADYINDIFKGMTVKQAEVIHELLSGETQQKVAAELNKSKSTISQIVSSGKWAEIERLMQQYEKLLNLLV